MPTNHAPARRAAPPPRPATGVGKEVVEIHGIHVSVPGDAIVVFFAQAFADTESNAPTHCHVTATLERAWQFLHETLFAGGKGHVIAYDVFRRDDPKQIRCMGRIDIPPKIEEAEPQGDNPAPFAPAQRQPIPQEAE